MSAYAQVDNCSYHESTYGLGWMRSQLPNTLVKFGTNVGLLGEGTVIERAAESKLVISHYGSMPGNFAAVLMFPETESAIIVLTNTTPACDMSDYITQFLIRILFDMPEQVDILAWVRRTVEEELKWYPKLLAEMSCESSDPIDLGDLKQYTGRYWNSSRTLLIEIRSETDGLAISFKGRDDEVWPLTPCRDETFSWLQLRNKLVSRGRVVLQLAPYYQIRFARSGDRSITSFFWTHDSQLPQGEEYISK
jgi:hypothetical protein